MQHEQVSGVVTTAQRAMLIGIPLVITIAFCGAYGAFKIEQFHRAASSTAAQSPQPIFSAPIPVMAPLPQAQLSLITPMETNSGITVVSQSDSALSTLLYDSNSTDPQTAAAVGSLQQADDSTGQAAAKNSIQKKASRQDGALNTKQSRLKTYLEHIKDDFDF